MRLIKLLLMSYIFTIPAYILTGIPGIMTFVPIAIVVGLFTFRERLGLTK